MAIFSAVPPPPELAPATTPVRTTKTPTRATTTSPPAGTPPPVGYVFPSPATRATPIDIDAWTVHALESLSVSPLARGTRSPLSINIDEQRRQKQRVVSARTGEVEDGKTARVYIEEERELVDRDPIRRPPSRRDSQRKREMLLKGKEGSRQRRRWENDRLMHVPNAQPPAPSDWHPHPTHPIHHIPYALASYWDQNHHLASATSTKATSFQKRTLERTSAHQAASKRAQLLRGTATGLGAGEVPRDLREAAKRSQVVKGWVRDLEAPIREWVRRERRRGEEDEESVGSDEEEIMFAGRAANGARRKRESFEEEQQDQKQRATEAGMVLDSFGDVENASYKRWLTHSISAYYGLQSHSVIIQDPKRKVVYIGLKNNKRGKGTVGMMHLPRPLWEICC